MGPPARVVDGLLLCRSGGNRLAFPARQVVAVEAYDPVLEAPNARVAFSLAPTPGRTLIAESGEAVIVDEVLVHQEALSLLPSPAIAGGATAGWLKGFISARDQLWPVLDLADFSRYLRQTTPAEVA